MSFQKPWITDRAVEEVEFSKKEEAVPSKTR
jgi:hypothetical protein